MQEPMKVWFKEVNIMRKIVSSILFSFTFHLWTGS